VPQDGGKEPHVWPNPIVEIVPGDPEFPVVPAPMQMLVPSPRPFLQGSMRLEFRDLDSVDGRARLAAFAAFSRRCRTNPLRRMIVSFGIACSQMASRFRPTLDSEIVLLGSPRLPPSA
jgi:hypothetical protein